MGSFEDLIAGGGSPVKQIPIRDDLRQRRREVYTMDGCEGDLYVARDPQKGFYYLAVAEKNRKLREAPFVLPLGLWRALERVIGGYLVKYQKEGQGGFEVMGAEGVKLKVWVAVDALMLRTETIAHARELVIPRPLFDRARASGLP